MSQLRHQRSLYWYCWLSWLQKKSGIKSKGNEKKRGYFLSIISSAAPSVWAEGCGRAGVDQQRSIFEHHHKGPFIRVASETAHVCLQHRLHWSCCVYFPRLCVSVNEMPRRGRKLALRWRGGAGEWAARRRPEAMLCLDAALPTDTTGNNNKGGGGDYFL